MKHTVQQTSPALQTAADPGLQRRQLGRLALGAAAALGLAACGGGGGGSDPISLREAYDRMVKGLTKKQVIEIIGRTPNSSSPGSLGYRDDSSQLLLTFFTDSSKSRDDYLISGANWYTLSGPKQDLNKTLL